MLTAGWIAARTLTLERFDTSWGDAVVSTIWGAYLGDLRAWAFGLAGAGIIVAAAAARPDGERWARVPAGARAAAALLAGALLLADRDLALGLAAAGAAGLSSMRAPSGSSPAAPGSRCPRWPAWRSRARWRRADRTTRPS